MVLFGDQAPEPLAFPEPVPVDARSFRAQAVDQAVAATHMRQPQANQNLNDLALDDDGRRAGRMSSCLVDFIAVTSFRVSVPLGRSSRWRAGCLGGRRWTRRPNATDPLSAGAARRRRGENRNDFDDADVTVSKTVGAAP